MINSLTFDYFVNIPSALYLEIPHSIRRRNNLGMKTNREVKRYEYYSR